MVRRGCGFFCVILQSKINNKKLWDTIITNIITTITITVTQ